MPLLSVCCRDMPCVRIDLFIGKDSERVLAMLLMDHTDKIKYYHMLGKKMQKKIEPLILSDEVEYAYDINLISQVAYKMISILDFDFAELNDGVFYVKSGCKF